MASHDENTIDLNQPTGLQNWGEFKILHLLGRGGSGEVYLAHDPTLGRNVALKLGRPDRWRLEERLQTAMEEARILASLRHPNIVTVYGAACHDSRIGFWMEYIEGADYAKIIKTQGPLAAEEAIRVGMDVCRALSQVHALGLLHRDIKAHNIIREKGGRTVLMDFGTMALQRKRDENGEQNLSGTPHFMPPEIFEGGEITPASDIYSLGVLLFYLLSGKMPIPGESLPEVLYSIQEGKRRRLRDVCSNLDIGLISLVEKSFASRAADRYQSAAEMEAELNNALPQIKSESDSTPESVAPARQRNKRRRLAWAAGMVVLAVGLSLGVSHFRPAKSQPLEVASKFLRRNTVGSSYSSIHSGDHLNLGDVLQIELRSDEDIFVYVINQDDRGHTFLLFPSARWALTNPLSPAEGVMLPGRTATGRMAAGWEVSSEGGRENFLLVASRTRLTDFEQELASLPEAGDSPGGGEPFQLGPTQLVGLYRGVGGVAFSQEQEALAGSNLNSFARLAGAESQNSSQNKDIWVGWVSFGSAD